MFRRLAQWLNNAHAVTLAILVHVIAFTVLMVNLDWADPTTKVIKTAMPIKTSAVDTKLIEKELERVRQVEKKKKAEEKKRQKKIEREKKKLAKLEKKRKAKKKELERLALKKKKAEEKRKRLKKIKQEKERKQAEQKRKKELEEKHRAKVEQQRRHAEMTAALEAEETASLIEHYASLINQHVQQRWDVPPDSSIKIGMSCEVSVALLPGGDILSVSIKVSSGNKVFDESAIKAIRRAEPLPVPPPEKNLFDEFRNITIPFKLKTKKI